MKKKILKALKWIFIAILAVLFVGIVWNFICKRVELPKIEDAYGQAVEVNGCEMRVDIKGSEGSPAVILLSGWGCASPVLEFEPLSTKLSEHYRVITIEPFGYGLSDESGEERSVENIVDELHQCVQTLGLKEYYLMGHSIAGVYALYWANEYQEEVQGFIGIDPSVPKMTDEEPFPVSTVTLNKIAAYIGKASNVTGLTRIRSISDPWNAVYGDITWPYMQDSLNTYRILSIDRIYNKEAMKELGALNDNLDVIRDMKFPEHMKVLQYISSDNCDVLPGWEQLHRDTMPENGVNQMIKLEGGHYLHFEYLEEIVEGVNDFIG